jgi:hypothetical protein
VIGEGGYGRERAWAIEGDDGFGCVCGFFVWMRNNGWGGAHVHVFQCLRTPPLRKGYSHFSQILKPGSVDFVVVWGLDA